MVPVGLIKGDHLRLTYLGTDSFYFITHFESYQMVFIYRRYPAISCSFRWSMFWPHPGGRATSMALQPLFPGIVFLMSLVLVHAGYLICNWHSLNINYYGTTFDGMPGSLNSSQINVCGGLGLHKMFPLRGFEPGTSHMPGKRCTTMLQLPLDTGIDFDGGIS